MWQGVVSHNQLPHKRNVDRHYRDFILLLIEFRNSQPRPLIRQGHVPKETGTALVQTTQENMHFYAPQQIERAKRARKLLEICGTTLRDHCNIAVNN